MLQNAKNKTPNYKTPNATKRPMQQNAQCYKTPNVTKHPMQQKAQNKKPAQFPKKYKNR